MAKKKKKRKKKYNKNKNITSRNKFSHDLVFTDFSDIRDFSIYSKNIVFDKNDMLKFEKQIYEKFENDMLADKVYIVIDKYKLTIESFIPSNILLPEEVYNKVKEVEEMEDDITASLKINEYRNINPIFYYNEDLVNRLAEIYCKTNLQKAEEFYLENIENHSLSLTAKNRYATFLRQNKRTEEIINVYKTDDFSKIIPKRELFAYIEFYNTLINLSYYLFKIKERKKAIRLVKILKQFNNRIDDYYIEEKSEFSILLFKKNALVFILKSIFIIIIYILILPFFIIKSIYKLIKRIFTKK